MNEQMKIEISYTEDGMFGAYDENRDAVDIFASFAKFEEMLSEKLQAEFPGEIIQIENGIEDYHRVSPEDYEDHTVEVVGEIVHNLWESWGWIIAA